MVRHGSLFSGIGGFDLAAQWMGWENVFQVEKDKKCQERLKNRFSNSELYGDIDDFNGNRYTGKIDVLSGGPPCQPTSNAGKRKGEKDDRWKWPEAIRVFGEIRPRFAVFENPDDLLSLDNGRAFERICVSLEDFGYTVETYGVPAACVGAWHERDRIWIIAYANHISDARKLDNRTIEREAKGSEGENESQRQTSHRQRIWTESNPGTQVVSNADAQRLSESTRPRFGSFLETAFTPRGCELGGIHAAPGSYWETEPGVVRMVHGLPDRVDRIKGLGNAIVPQVVLQIFKAIEAVNNNIQ